MAKVKKNDFPYLHGFSPKEQERLKHQAAFAEQNIFRDINFSNTKNLLEVGCGVGAQSEILLRRFPKIKLTGIDLSQVQIDECNRGLSKLSYAKDRYKIINMDATKTNFKKGEFDAAFLCWILEHAPKPMDILKEVKRVLAPGGQIIITEVMNSTFFLNPYSPHVWKYWMVFNDYQDSIGGDPFIGMKLGNMLLKLGYTDIVTEIKTWHYDSRHVESRKDIVAYWTDLLLSASDQLIKEKLVTKVEVEEVKKELKIVASDKDAVFHYSFMQARARV